MTDKFNSNPRPGEFVDLPLTNDCEHGPKVRLETDATGRMTMSEVRNGRVVREIARGRDNHTNTHDVVARWRADQGIGQDPYRD